MGLVKYLNKDIGISNILLLLKIIKSLYIIYISNN